MQQDHEAENKIHLPSTWNMAPMSEDVVCLTLDGAQVKPYWQCVWELDFHTFRHLDAHYLVICRVDKEYFICPNSVYASKEYDTGPFKTLTEACLQAGTRLRLGLGKHMKQLCTELESEFVRRQQEQELERKHERAEQERDRQREERLLT